MKHLTRLLIGTWLCMAGIVPAKSIYAADLPSQRDSIVRISLGGGMVFSTVNVGLEPVGEIKSAINGRLNVKFRRRLGLSAEFTNQFQHDALPAWGMISSRTFDLNLNYMYFHVAQTSSIFYGLIGACFQQWKGTYLGTPAFTKDIYDYQIGEQKSFNFPSVNLGIGFERFYKQVGVFGEFKFRFGQDFVYDSFGIVDVCVSLGAKINLISIDPRPRISSTTKNRNHKMKIKPKIYHWF